MRSKRAIFLLVFVALATIAFKQTDDYFEVSKNLDIFSDVYKEINVSYVDQVKPGELIREAIDGMLGSLDPYTNFYSEAQAEDYMFQVTGSYGGIGATIKTKGEFNIVTRPYSGFPAQKADLRAGDIIVKVDGKSVQGKNSKQLKDLLKGSAGSKVDITIKRPGIGELEKTITRADIKVKNVPYFGKIDEETGYIKLTGFTPNAGKEVKEALEALKSEGISQVILDLRGNGGGLLHEAVNIVNVFIPKGEIIVKTIGKEKENNRVYKTLNSPVDTEIPLAILIDGGSASASEIVSGSIQDLDRGVIIGQKSFGKGLVQGTRRLSYNTQMKLTTAKYYIPSGRCIQKLDYTNKKNGKAIITADSLKHIFYTKNKRKVVDGEGVTPDVTVTPKDPAKLVVSLIKKDLIFDFATQYRNQNETISNPKEFRLSDQEYSSFVEFMKTKDYEYTTDTEKALSRLIDKSKEEEYHEALLSEIEALEDKLMQQKTDDINTYKDEIRELLEMEIASRYYYEKAFVEATFDDDKDISKSIELLSNSYQYNTVLQVN